MRLSRLNSVAQLSRGLSW